MTEVEWDQWRGMHRVQCPQCGMRAPIDETHSVSADGAVSPSLVCDCGFHEFVRLKDYEAS